MAYYKYLDLDFNPVREKIIKYFLVNPRLLNSIGGAWINANTPDLLEKIPELSQLFRPLNLTIHRVSFFVMYQPTGTIHIDDDTHDLRINFPILNCENTETRFYKTSSKTTKMFQTNKMAYHRFDPKDCELADKFTLNKAAIIKTKEPHQVVLLSTTYPRVSCTIAFNEDLTDLFDSL